MDKKNWQKVIKNNCKSLGTYKDEFEPIIETLSQILEDRDLARKQWKDEGSIFVVEHTNKAGATNSSKNPLVMMINDLNAQALSYWKELGGTPSALRKMTSETIEIKKENTIEDVLSGLLDG